MKKPVKNERMNRYGLRSVLFMLLAALLIGSGPAAGEFPVDAQNVTADCTVSLSGSAGEPKDLNTAKLLDGEYTTYVPLSGGDVLRITAAAEFTALYIIWNKVPGSWTLSAGNHSYTLGTHGYLHEFVDVKALTGAAVKEASVTIPKDLSVCDVYAFTEGSLPDWVQVWQPPCEKADLMLLSTHSDDEQLFFAGVLPYYAGEIGAAVQVVYLTNHWDVQNRPHEQINGLWTVGVRNYPIVGPFPDDADTLNRTGESVDETLRRTLEIFGEDALVRYQVEMIRRFKPQVIVAHDANGEYQHGAHIANTYSLRKALEPAADPAQYEESAQQYGTWAVPKTYLHLWEENKIVMNWDEPLSKFGGKTAFEVSKSGYACHRSQQWTWFTKWLTGTAEGESDTIAKASEITKYSPCEYGLYQTAVGSDTNADFLDHITLYRDQVQDPPLEDPTPAPEGPTDVPGGSASPAATGNGSAADEGKDSDLGTILIYCVMAACVLCILIMAAASARSKKKGRSR